MIDKILQDEHMVVADLLRRILAGEGDRLELFRQLQMELLSHTEAEEDVVYSMLIDEERLGDLVLDARDEHHVVEQLLGEAQEAFFDIELFLAKIELVEELVLEHVAKEESVVLPEAARLFDDAVQQGLAGEFLAEKAEILRAMEGGFVRRAAARLSQAVAR